MPKFWNEYHIPETLDAALDLLARYDGRARVVGGGTDLFLDFLQAYYSGERPHVDAIIDVTRIAGANTLSEADDHIVVGCGVTHGQLVASPIIRAHATALAEACAVVGGPQVRNVATLVGNIAHALPAADGTVALMILEAEVEIASVGSGPVARPVREWRALASLFEGPGLPAVDSTREVITSVRFRPTRALEASAFTRVMRPQGVALPVLTMAARVRLSADTGRAPRLEEVAISAGPVAPVPFRASRTEQFLRGSDWNVELVPKAAQVLLGEAAPRTSAHRATREYRVELLPTLLGQVLATAVERARESVTAER